MRKSLIAASAALGVGAALCAALAPSRQKHPLTNQFLHRNFAHRGLFNNLQVAENSMEAFALAVEGGYGIEPGRSAFRRPSGGGFPRRPPAPDVQHRRCCCG